MLGKTFLPITKKEIDDLGWDYVDIIMVTGDAYVDHPSFGSAVIGRVLEDAGFRIALLPQPNWKDDLRDFKKMGKPRLYFGVSAGSMDSMVNHYTAAKRLRSDDAYTPGGMSGFRPDYATVVYTQILKKLYPDVPVIIGGIEASMRRFTHYDYWSDQLKPPILIESGADILVYGMGEKVMTSLAMQLEQHGWIDKQNTPQIGYLSDNLPNNAFPLAAHEAALKSKKTHAENFRIIETESNKQEARILAQPVANQYVIVNPPDPHFTTEDLDHVYSLPFVRRPHPKYKKRGDIPAFEMIKFSVNIHRGCFGGCSFCTISAHQGKQIISRSEASILQEIADIADMHDFKGYLSDLGGPSANMYGMKGNRAALCQTCSRNSCIYPQICTNLNRDHRPLTALYKKVNALPYIKKAFVGSGVRYDLFLRATEEQRRAIGAYEYLDELIHHHVSGRLKVAPEHTEEEVLHHMRKPSFDLFLEIKQLFEQTNRKYHLKQQIIPYFISSHPACKLHHMQSLSQKLHHLGYHLEQVQDFTPTPMTTSTEMYYTGLNPDHLDALFVERDPQKKKQQNQCFFTPTTPPSKAFHQGKNRSQKRR